MWINGRGLNTLSLCEKCENFQNNLRYQKYYPLTLFLFILLLKVGMDCLVLFISLRRLNTSFMGVCGLSVFLVDVALACAVVTVWLLGPDRSPVSVCFLLAQASAVFNALPLPVLGLGLLDYATESRYTSCHAAPCRTLWNCTLTLLVWVLAGVRSGCSAFTILIEVEYEGGRHALGCVVQESVFVVHFSVGISVAVCCVLMLHYKRLSSWLKEANRLSEYRDNVNPTLHSDLSFRYAKFGKPGADKDEEKALAVETEWQRHPLYLGLTLGFSTTWASYLVMCVACELLGLAVPAYIAINLLWLECANSLLVGLANRKWAWLMMHDKPTVLPLHSFDNVPFRYDKRKQLCCYILLLIALLLAYMILNSSCP
uniref:Uncharacterized protein n=1 Tax=Oncorhynchus kisutch TaxID=8019 RepID=A0A8C7GPH9_ONCKI